MKKGLGKRWLAIALCFVLILLNTMQGIPVIASNQKQSEFDHTTTAGQYVIPEETVTEEVALRSVGSAQDIGLRAIYLRSVSGVWTGESFFEQLDDTQKQLYKFFEETFKDGNGDTDHPFADSYLDTNIGITEYFYLIPQKDPETGNWMVEQNNGHWIPVYETDAAALEQKRKELTEGIQFAINAFVYDHPEIYWIDVPGTKIQTSTKQQNYSVPVMNADGTAMSDEPTTITLTGEVSLSIRPASKAFDGTKAEVDKLLQEGVAAIQKKLENATAYPANDYGKLMAIHDYVCETVSYDDAGLNDPINQTVWSALSKKSTVCAGYAKLFKLLCEQFDYTCILVSGKGVSTQGEEAHMWNYVQLGYNWYAVDTTWDDQEANGTYHDFFLTGSEESATNFGGKTFAESHLASGKLSGDNDSQIFGYPGLYLSKYEQIINPVTLTIQSKETISYGEEMTITVQGLPEEGSNDTVSFYIAKDGATDATMTTPPLGAKLLATVERTGSSAGYNLSNKQLQGIGNYGIYAVYSGNASYEGAFASKALTVEHGKPTIHLSSEVTKVSKYGELELEVTIKYPGKLDSDPYPASFFIVTSAYANDEYPITNGEITADGLVYRLKYRHPNGSKIADGTVISLQAVLSDNGNYGVAVSQEIDITYTDRKQLSDDQMILTMNDWVYGETASRLTASVQGVEGNFVIDCEYSADGGNSYKTALPKSSSGNIEAGTYLIKAQYTSNEYEGEKVKEFTVSRRDILLQDGTLQAEDKIYDGTTSTSIKGSPELSGIIDKDLVTVAHYSNQAEFQDAAVGSDKEVIVSGYQLTGEDADNYELAQDPIILFANIHKKPVSLHGVIAIDRIYNGETDVTLTGGTLGGVITNDSNSVTVNVPKKGKVDTADVGNDKVVTFATPTLSGTAAGNYELAQIAPVTVDIKPFVPSLTIQVEKKSEKGIFASLFGSYGDKVEVKVQVQRAGENAKAPEGTISLLLDGEEKGGTIDHNGAYVIEISPEAGNHNIEAVFYSSSANYADSSKAQESFDIEKANLGTMTLDGELVYGETLQAVLSNTPVDAGTITYEWARIPQGGSAILISGANKDTYQLGKEDIGCQIQVKAIPEKNYNSSQFVSTNVVEKANQPAPTGGIVDDTNNTFAFTYVSGKGQATDYEYSLDGGNTFQKVEKNPIEIGNIRLDNQQLAVRLKETATHKAGDCLYNDTIFTADLEGSLSLGGEARYGQVLTANLIGQQQDAKLHFKWLRNGIQVGGDLRNYVIQGEDVGQQITVEVTADGYVGMKSIASDQVKKKLVYVEFGSTLNKVYDGKATMEVDGIVSNQLVNPQDELHVSAQVTYQDCNVGNDIPVTIEINDKQITGSEKDWYDVKLKNIDQTGDILPRTLEPIVNFEGVSKVYDGNKDVVGTLPKLSFNGVVPGESVTASAEYSYRDANAGDNKWMFVTNITLDPTNKVNHNYYLQDTELKVQGGVITKADAQTLPGYNVPNDLYAITNVHKTLSAVAFPQVEGGTWSWKDGTVALSAQNDKPVQKFQAIFTPNDQANYTPVEQEIALHVSALRIVPANWTSVELPGIGDTKTLHATTELVGSGLTAEGYQMLNQNININSSSQDIISIQTVIGKDGLDVTITGKQKGVAFFSADMNQEKFGSALVEVAQQETSVADSIIDKMEAIRQICSDPKNLSDSEKQLVKSMVTDLLSLSLKEKRAMPQNTIEILDQYYQQAADINVNIVSMAENNTTPILKDSDIRIVGAGLAAGLAQGVNVEIRILQKEVPTTFATYETILELQMDYYIDGKKVDLNFPLMIHMVLPEQMCSKLNIIRHIKDDGTVVEDLLRADTLSEGHFTIDQNVVAMLASDFSSFAFLAEKKEEPTNPSKPEDPSNPSEPQDPSTPGTTGTETGDQTNGSILFGLLLISGAILIVLQRKKQHN